MLARLTSSYVKVFDQICDDEMIDILEIRNPMELIHASLVVFVSQIEHDFEIICITINNEDRNLTEEILEHIEMKSINYISTITRE